MSADKRSVCLIASGLSGDNTRLQPWRYLLEAAKQLDQLGHPVTLISDDKSGMTGLHGIGVQRLASAGNPRWKANRALAESARQLNPDVIVWHVGLTSFLHQDFNLGLKKPALGIFTSPLYRARDLRAPGPGKLLAGYRLSRMAVIGSLLPAPLLRARMSGASLAALVVQTETTRRMLQRRALWQRPIHLIPPGVDGSWLRAHSQTSQEVRRTRGYAADDTLVVFFGSPAPLRGLPTLLEAFELARRSDGSLKLLALSRRQGNEPAWQGRRPSGAPLNTSGVQVIEGLLAPGELASYVAAGDVVALPFELVPSDAPLSLLEARALGKPLVTTRVACLPELAGPRAYLAQPGDRLGLAKALLQAAQQARQRKAGAHPPCDPTPAWGWEQVGAAWSQLIQSL
jgi:glycosyltransferase involved in cell wall biosynthesis